MISVVEFDLPAHVISHRAFPPVLRRYPAGTGVAQFQSLSYELLIQSAPWTDMSRQRYAALIRQLKRVSGSDRQSRASETSGRPQLVYRLEVERIDRLLERLAIERCAHDERFTVLDR